MHLQLVLEVAEQRPGLQFRLIDGGIRFQFFEEIVFLHVAHLVLFAFVSQALRDELGLQVGQGLLFGSVQREPPSLERFVQKCLKVAAEVVRLFICRFQVGDQRGDPLFSVGAYFERRELAEDPLQLWQITVDGVYSMRFLRFARLVIDLVQLDLESVLIPTTLIALRRVLGDVGRSAVRLVIFVVERF